MHLVLELTTVGIYFSWVKRLKRGSSQGRGKGAIAWSTEPNREVINALERVYIHPGDILQRQSSFDLLGNHG
jgi:hypothetical protein